MTIQGDKRQRKETNDNQKVREIREARKRGKEEKRERGKEGKVERKEERKVEGRTEGAWCACWIEGETRDRCARP